MGYTIQDQYTNIVKEQQQPHEKVNFYFYYGKHVCYSVKIPNTHVLDTHVLDTHKPDTHQPDTITTRIPLFYTFNNVLNVVRTWFNI